MIRLFKNPPVYYRVIPLWIWNAKPDKQELERQVRLMHSKGVGGFLIQTTPTDESGCTQREWDGFIDHVTGIAGELGIRAYRYDGLLLYSAENSDTITSATTLNPDYVQSCSDPCDLFTQKLISSKAHIARQRRVPAEIFPGFDWPYSLEEAKINIDKQAATGVNLFCPNIIYYKLDGGSTSTSAIHAPWWKHYKIFADYAARVAYALSQGVHHAQAALLIPPQDQTASFESCRSIAEQLSCLHIDYDILTEESLMMCTAVDQRLYLRDEGYELLVVPPQMDMEPGTIRKIEEFVEDGGSVLAFPTLLENALFSGDRQAIYEYIASSIPELIKRDISITVEGKECGDISAIHRTIEDSDIYFITNTSSQIYDAEITVRHDGAPHLLDPETGEMAALLGCTQVGSRTILQHRFERYQSIILYFGNEPLMNIARHESPNGYEITISDDWDFSLEDEDLGAYPPHAKLRSGSWTDQGYPFYSGTAAYKKQINIPEFYRGNRIILSAREPAGVVEFIVNGASAGVRAWSPFEMDITSLVKPGPNSIEIKITNTSANALLRITHPSGLLHGACITIC